MRQNMRLVNYVRDIVDNLKAVSGCVQNDSKKLFFQEKATFRVLPFYTQTSPTSIHPSVTWGSRTFVSIPTQTRYPNTVITTAGSRGWSTGSDKENNEKARSFISQGTSKAWFPLGTCLAVGFLLCLPGWQLQLKLFLRGENQSHGFPDV